jgi:hypothetical protein
MLPPDELLSTRRRSFYVRLTDCGRIPATGGEPMQNAASDVRVRALPERDDK